MIIDDATFEVRVNAICICNRTLPIASLALAIGLSGCGAPANHVAGTEQSPVPSKSARNSMLGPSRDPTRLSEGVLARAKDATVLIGNFEGGTLTATGSGFVAGDGRCVVSNKHVMTGTDDVPDDLKLVFFSGTDKARIVQVPASSVHFYGLLPRGDADYHKEDLAYAKIGALVSRPLSIADHAEIQETMPVWAFGFPRGTSILSDRDMPSVTVHCLRVERLESNQGIVTLLQLSGSPTFGNSGGPVVNEEGKVVGVIDAKTPDAPILFAVPSIRVAKMLTGQVAQSKSLAERWRSPLNIDTRYHGAYGGAGFHVTSPQAQATSSALGSRKLATDDLVGLSAKDLTLLRNEPFARRGYVFHRADLNRVFGQKAWYVPRTSDMGEVQRTLSRCESYNIDLIKAYQNAHGLNY